MKKIFAAIGAALALAAGLIFMLASGQPAKAEAYVTPLDPSFYLKLYESDETGGGSGEYITIQNVGGTLQVMDSLSQTIAITPSVASFLELELPSPLWSQISFAEGKVDFIPVELWGVRQDHGVLLQLGGTGAFTQSMSIPGYPAGSFDDWGKKIRVPAQQPCSDVPLDPSFFLRLYTDDTAGGGSGEYITIQNVGGTLQVMDSLSQTIAITPSVASFLELELPSPLWSQGSFAEGTVNFVPVELWGVRQNHGVLLQLGSVGTFSQSLRTVPGYPVDIFNDWAKKVRVPARCQEEPPEPTHYVYLPLIMR